MRIVQLVPSLEGGEQAQEVLEFAQELSRQGHESVVVSAGGALVSRLTLHNSQHFELPLNRTGATNFLLHRKLRQLLESIQPDILIGRGPLCSWRAWKAWTKLPIATRPRLVTAFAEWPHTGLWRGRRINKSLAQGELVLAGSQSLGQQLQQRYGLCQQGSQTPGEKSAGTGSGALRTLYRGVNTRELDQAALVSGHWHQRIHNDFPQLEGRNWLLLPGSVAPGGGQEQFLALLAALKEKRPDIFGLIVGDVAPGQEKFARSLERRAEAMGLGEYVLFLGARRDMRELYGSARITFDLADKPRSSGRIVTEALAMGCPAVASGGVAGEILQSCFPQGRASSDDLGSLANISCEILEKRQPIDFTGYSLAETTSQALQWFAQLRGNP